MLRTSFQVLKGFAAVAVGWEVYHAVKEFMDNSVVLYVFEQMVLPSEASDSYTELGFTVQGEIRLATKTTSRSTYVLKTNAQIEGSHDVPTTSSTPKGRGTPASNVDGDESWRTLDSADFRQASARQKVILKKTVLNDVCNLRSVGTGCAIQFTPACVSNLIFMRYESTPSDQFRVPLSVKDCWLEPGCADGVHHVSFEVTVSEDVFYATINFAFPKRSRITSYDHQNVGVFRSINDSGVEGGSSNEMVWDLGTFLKGENGSHRNVAGNGVAAGGQLPPKTPLGDETLRDVGNAAPHDYGQRLAQIRFSVNYVILDEAGRIIVASRDESSPRGGEAKYQNRRERRNAARAAGGSTSSPYFDTNDDCVQVPGISVAYKTGTTCSGFEVRKLEARSTTPNWDYPGASVPWIAKVADRIFRPKLRKEIGVVSAFSQVIKVESRL